MELVTVYEAASELDAQMMKSILEEEGIPAMVSAETYGRLLGGTFGTPVVGAVRLLVRPQDAERAASIISEIRIDAGGPHEEIG